jgi:hypothetical protein
LGERAIFEAIGTFEMHCAHTTGTLRRMKKPTRQSKQPKPITQPQLASVAGGPNIPNRSSD